MDKASKRWRIAGLGLAGLLIAAAAHDDNPVKAGVDAWSKGDYKKAVADWRGPAAKGDADAQFDLAQAYKLGRGVPVDLAQAQEYYRKAALQGHVQASDNYGLSLFQAGKQADAVPWLEKSAMRGEPRAQLVYGTMLFNGDGGVPKDWVRAYALIVRSSASGLSQGSQTLAKMDQYIPLDQRQKGLALARQYEADAQRPQLPAEITGGGTQVAALPPVSHAPSIGKTPGAPYPVPGAKPPHPPVVKPAPTSMSHPVPPPTHSAPPASLATAGGKWRIQLGAFGTEGNAKALWQRLQPKVGALGGLQPYIVHAGTVTRLQAGPLGSSGDAGRVCAAVKRAGNACLPVAP